MKRDRGFRMGFIAWQQHEFEWADPEGTAVRPCYSKAPVNGG